ncbi:MAG TPA: AAA family ATPase [Deltaproteobacteria bacterium]|jgi:dephospho-CoA kinase|nr:AAA family ATPase [Deltaproteobacteria bacterium]HOI07379.1 AAA family ATPase [Deltaproteobacteria bacterium]
MKIFIIVGMPASGKSIAGEYALTEGYPIFSTGDIVRAELKIRGLEPGPETMASVSTELRGEDGMGVTRRALARALEQDSPVVFLEGMRSWPEIELVREQADAVVVAFLAPRPLRKARIISRGRPDDSPEEFDRRDKREIDYGAAIPIALADAYVLNTSTMEAAIEDLHGIVRSYLV